MISSVRTTKTIISQARWLNGVLLIVVALLGGCASSSSSRDWTGPTRRAPVSLSPWTSRPAPASVLSSPRYTIYTTLPAGDRRDALAQVLEGAYAQYQLLAPATPIDDRPMHCFVFADREDWEDFTSRRTGDDATMYLSIPRGGYTIDDWFVAYSDTDRGIVSAAAHEGWHQYVARHFVGRLPPFLEEGVACLFEDVRVEQGLPRWNTSVNPGRVHALTAAMANGGLWPLEELVTLDAGYVVQTSRPRTNAFYAQSWAFARFLNEAESGRYRPMFQRLLADAAAGRTPTVWKRGEAKAALERYLGQDFAAIERAYDAFVAQVTRQR
jgi:hypothetical protein